MKNILTIVLSVSVLGITRSNVIQTQTKFESAQEEASGTSLKNGTLIFAQVVSQNSF